MDFYCTAEVQQLAPVLALCLGKGSVSEILRQLFEKVNLNDQIWDNFIIKNRLLSAKYILRYEDSKQSVIQAVQKHREKTPGFHSLLSPFNASSDLFPNGIISDAWFRKYVQDVPFAMVVTHGLTLESDVNQLGETLLRDMKTCSGLGIGYLAIVVSDGLDSKSDSENIDLLRRKSGLPYKSLLFYLNRLSESIEQDCGVVVSSIVKSLKSSALDFYSLIERRVYHRSDKYYTMPISNTKTNIMLTPKVLETRNLIKRGMLLQLMSSRDIEGSLEVIERAYENVLDIIAENATTLAQPNQPPHDTATYKRWVKLLDILIIHLVRGYFSIEEPIAALRKHVAHIGIVQKLLKNYSPASIALWTACQYHWLADLMVLVPEDVLSNVNIKRKERSKSAFLQFYGGVKLSDKSHVTTLPYLVYAKAAGYVLTSNHIPESDLILVKKSSDVMEYKARLIRLALETNQSSSSPSSTYSSYLQWKLAQTYSALERYPEAVEAYEKVDTGIVSSMPRVHIIEEMLRAAYLHPDKDAYITQVLKNSLAENDGINTEPQKELASYKPEILDTTTTFVEVEASMFNLNASEETNAFDDISSQFVLKSKFSPKLIERCFKDTEASIELQNIIVSYGHGQKLTLNKNGTQLGNIQEAQIESETASYNFSNFGDEPLILLATEKALNTGWISIKQVEVTLQVIVQSGTSKLVIMKTELHRFSQEKIANSLKLYNSQEPTVKTLRLKGRSATSLLVKPFFPTFECKASSNLAFILLGERVRVPMEISSLEVPLDKLAFNNIRVYVKSRIFRNSQQTKEFSMQINWDGLKDDEPLEILEEVKSGKTQHRHTINASIRKSPNGLLEGHGQYTAYLDFSIGFIERSGAETDEELFTMEVPIYLEIFAPKFEIFPLLPGESPSALTCPFVIEPELKDFSMPMPSRTWRLKSDLNVQHHLFEQNQISIDDVELVVESKSAEITVDWVGGGERGVSSVSRLFEVNGRHHSFPHSASILVHANITYSRPDSEEKLTVELNPREFVLQLQDPRLLLQVYQKGQDYEFQYFIENPTSRIFTFAASMSADKALLHGNRWEFDEARNELSLSNNLVHVLPRSLAMLTYHGTVVAEKPQRIELPALQVFDVNYKVSLPAIPLQDSIKDHESVLILER